MQDEFFGIRWVRYDISWWNPCTVVRNSIVVLSLVHQTEDLALGLPKIMVNKELQEEVSLKTFSKLDRKVSNSNLTWLGDIHTTPT